MQQTPSLTLGRITIDWINGGHFQLDGGTMFGAVPKVLWQKKCPAAEDNTIALVNDILLIRTPDCNAVVDTGLGNKLSEKQKKIFKVEPQWDVVDELARRGLKRDDIDHVLLTHCDFDHAGGVVMKGDQGDELTFPRATHHIHQLEWEDVKQPCRRAQSTYFEENFTLLEQSGLINLTGAETKICPGIVLRHTGGHTRGHQLVEIQSEGETAVHLGDLFPTHHHLNPLWIMAYDNFPLEVIDRKEQYFDYYGKLNSWFTFYHDPSVKACRIDGQSVAACWPS